MDREDRRRYFVVGSVILEIVTPVFRKKIKNTYKGQGKASFKDFLNHPPILHILFHLRHKNTWCCQDRNNCVSSRALPLNYCQWDLLYSQSAGACGRLCHCKYLANPVETKDLDITLASLIILNCCNLTPNEDTLIENLRIFKNNYLSHNTKGGITLAEYKTLWADLTSYVIQLDPGKQDDLIRIEKRPLDESLCTHYVGSLLDLHKKLDEIDAKADANHAELMEKMDVLIKRETCDCSKNKTRQQKKPYRLGQDIFTLHHQTDLRSVFNVDRIGYVSDGVMMDDGRLVLCVQCPQRLLICNTDGSEVDSIPLQDIPWNVTAVNNSTVAVTLVSSQRIEMYDINNKHKLKSIPVPGWCRGITTINNKLVVGCIDRLLMIDDQTGEVVQTIHTDCLLPRRLHTSGDRIFYCDNITLSNNHNLYCYSYTDDKETTLTLPSQPYSITSLQDGSLYVGCWNGSVQHVSSDVQHYKPVKTKGLQSYEDGNVFTYNVTQRKLLTFDKTGIIKIFEHR